jgi:hypothetical protein
MPDLIFFLDESIKYRMVKNTITETDNLMIRA